MCNTCLHESGKECGDLIDAKLHEKLKPDLNQISQNQIEVFAPFFKAMSLVHRKFQDPLEDMLKSLEIDEEISAISSKFELLQKVVKYGDKRINANMMNPIIRYVSLFCQFTYLIQSYSSAYQQILNDTVSALVSECLTEQQANEISCRFFQNYPESNDRFFSTELKK